MAFGLAVSASPCRLPHTTQDSLPAAGQTLPDGLLPAGFLRKVSELHPYISSSFPKLACAITSTDAPKPHPLLRGVWNRRHPIAADSARTYGNPARRTRADKPVSFRGLLSVTYRSFDGDPGKRLSFTESLRRSSGPRFHRSAPELSREAAADYKAEHRDRNADWLRLLGWCYLSAANISHRRPSVMGRAGSATRPFGPRLQSIRISSLVLRRGCE